MDKPRKPYFSRQNIHEIFDTARQRQLIIDAGDYDEVEFVIDAREMRVSRYKDWSSVPINYDTFGNERATAGHYFEFRCVQHRQTSDDVSCEYRSDSDRGVTDTFDYTAWRTFPIVDE